MNRRITLRFINYLWLNRSVNYNKLNLFPHNYDLINKTIKIIDQITTRCMANIVVFMIYHLYTLKSHKN